MSMELQTMTDVLAMLGKLSPIEQTRIVRTVASCYGIHSTERQNPTSVAARVRSLLHASGAAHTASTIIAELALPTHAVGAVRAALKRFGEDGLIECVRRGRWRWKTVP